MRNKGFVVGLGIVISALCLYYLSFTLVSRTVQEDAIRHATESNGTVNLFKKQRYLDSLWNEPVYDFLGIQYTYKEVKESELNLGLDLQGGMHVVLEISPAEIIRGLSINPRDSSLNRALQKARENEIFSTEPFADLFVQAFEEDNPGVSLASLFVSSTNQDKISFSSSQAEVSGFIQQEITEAIDRSYIILKTRIDQFGTSQPNIQQLPGTGRIQIEIPGAENTQRVRNLLQSVAQLEFWEVVEYSDSQLSQALLAIDRLLTQENKQNATVENDLSMADTVRSAPTTDSIAEGGEGLEQQLQQAARQESPTLDSLQRGQQSALFAFSSARPFMYPLTDTTTINAIFRRPDVRILMPSTVTWYWDVKPETQESITGGESFLQLYFVRQGREGKPLLTGEVISDARLDYDQNARPAVSLSMNASGSKVWAKITAAQSAKQPRGRIAIVLDHKVYTAPSVESEIPNGKSQITGNFTLEEAKDLANVLKAGALPAPTHIVEEAIIGPTLGQVAQYQGFFSMTVGLILVVFFMVAYYARSGLVANVTLLFNIFFILGILAQLGSALTLPGIAGIVLTMGMAIDANVLIYERIKEEIQSGKKLKEAIRAGYQRAFSSIFDSNLTTLLTGIFLFILGQGPLKGFAIVLIIGIGTSFFSAVYISRVIVERMTRKGQYHPRMFETFISKLVQKRPSFSFIKHRYYFYGVSAMIIAIGFVIIFFNGLNLGVDFKGGRSYIVEFDRAVTATDMKLALRSSFYNAGTEVKNYGSNRIVKVTTSYLIDDPSEQADEIVRQTLIDGLVQHTHMQYTSNPSQIDEGHFTIAGSLKVGATIVDDIHDSAFETALFSLMAIFFYILIRFKRWTFSVGAVVATLHDAFFVVAIFGIATTLGMSLEVDQIFVAAMLTIIGYSINDTVIIFDRIREFLKYGSTDSRSRVFNNAINATLSRTLITSGTTLLVVVILLLFGGEALFGFAFALTIGMIIGTYSSVCIAAPAILDLDDIQKKKT